MTESAVYSLYTGVHDRGLVLVDEKHPGLDYGGHGLQVCLNGSGMGQDCGVYCCKKLRRWPADEGRHIFHWGGLDGKREMCRCELLRLNIPLFWRLSKDSYGQCQNDACPNRRVRY